MIYGYDARTVNEFGLKQMREVSISASPRHLRALASFLIDAASVLEATPSSPNWHRHSPAELARALGCDVIVAQSQPRDVGGDKDKGKDWGTLVD